MTQIYGRIESINGENVTLQTFGNWWRDENGAYHKDRVKVKPIPITFPLHKRKTLDEITELLDEELLATAVNGYWLSFELQPKMDR